ncbi:hypothetical protein K2X40_00835 [Candidatus Babeliales bacterium]|nr:hypothetical protein [Candidatus Babeliales bacterium]
MKNFFKNLQHAALTIFVVTTLGNQAQAAANNTTIANAKNALNSVVSQVESSLKRVGYTGSTISAILANLTDFGISGPKNITNPNADAVTQAQQIAKDLRTQIIINDSKLAYTTNQNIQAVIAAAAPTGTLGVLANQYETAINGITAS